jgi:fructokinase
MIISAGEALYDLFAQGDGDDGLTFDARVGGSPLNVAMGLARLGREAGFLTGLSTDLFGERLWAHLEKEGIDTELVVRMDRPTTLSVVGVDLAGVPSYAFYGAGAADRSLAPTDLPSWPDRARVLHIGSYSMVVDPVGSTLLGLARSIAGRCLVSYDPNVRPTIEPDMAIWRSRLEELLPSLSLLKISSEDFGLLYGDADKAAMAARWLEAGPALVVVTDGEDGAEAWTTDFNARAPGIEVDVVDTVGAGDTFQAALLAWLDENGLSGPDGPGSLAEDQLSDLLGFAVGAAAVTCSRRGADLPRREDVRN